MYRVESDSDDPSVWLIEGEKGTQAGTFVLTRVASGHDPAGDEPALTFDKNERPVPACRHLGIEGTGTRGYIYETRIDARGSDARHKRGRQVRRCEHARHHPQGQDGWGYDIRAESRHTPSGNGRRGHVSRRPLSRGRKDLRGDRRHRSAIEATSSSHSGTQAVSVSEANRRRAPLSSVCRIFALRAAAWEEHICRRNRRPIFGGTHRIVSTAKCPGSN